MPSKPYIKRIVDDQIERKMAALGAVVIEGPKACGKTMTAQRLAASEVRLDVDEGVRQAAALDPASVLDGPVPRLIDEWQLEPAIWNNVRRAIDDRGKPGQFILTGSIMPGDDATRHSGAGRLSRMRMRPLSLFEKNRSNGRISVSRLLDGAKEGAPEAKLKVPEIAEEIALGGWPGFLDMRKDQALEATGDYLEEIRRLDVATASGTRRNPVKVGQLLRSIGRNIATEVSTATLARDAGGADGPLDRATVDSYLDALRRLMVIEDQPAWGVHLRTTHTLRKASKLHFVDPSLAVAAMRSGPERLTQDLNLLGLLFESMVIRDLRVHAQAADADVLHYRDSDGLEVDAIVEARDGRWAAFEVKLGSNRVEEAAANLRKFVKRIDTDRCGPPAALGVIIGSGYGYKREDGVHVIPIGALGP
jgi:predicted AAA+ superfamily ATPase